MPSCKDCGKDISFFEAVGGRCSDCHFKNRRGEGLAAAQQEEVMAPSDAEPASIVLSTEAAPDLRVAERIDVITAEFAVGMNVLTDIFSAWRDVFGGRAKSYQNTLKEARQTVLLELRREAQRLGADAVLGVSLDYSEISGGGKSMLFLVASGTAVKLDRTVR